MGRGKAPRDILLGPSVFSVRPKAKKPLGLQDDTWYRGYSIDYERLSEYMSNRSLYRFGCDTPQNSFISQNQFTGNDSILLRLKDLPDLDTSGSPEYSMKDWGPSVVHELHHEGSDGYRLYPKIELKGDTVVATGASTAYKDIQLEYPADWMVYAENQIRKENPDDNLRWCYMLNDYSEIQSDEYLDYLKGRKPGGKSFQAIWLFNETKKRVEANIHLDPGNYLG